MTKEEIMAIYEKAKQGDAQSQYEIGRLYATGNGVKQNEQQAALWYKKAAAQGHEQAQESIDGLSTGDVDTQDVKAAARNNDKQEVPMKFCGNCGTAIKEGDTFCGNCGAKDGVGGSAAKAIVGSEGRYRDFNKYFLPRKEHLRHRWERVDIARITDIPLPAIQLYEIGGAYFVRDGNHRVSVARTQGIESLDAEVTSLSSEITIQPGMTKEQLKEAVVAFEKRIFYEKTNFGALTGDNGLNFTTPGQYDVIYNHILVHKYYLNQGHSGEIPFPDALVSWYNKVYLPIIKIIRSEWLALNFPGYSQSDLYVWIVKHWDFLKKKYGLGYSVKEAARDFSQRYGQTKGIRRFFAFFAMLIDRLLKKR